MQLWPEPVSRRALVRDKEEFCDPELYLGTIRHIKLRGGAKSGKPVSQRFCEDFQFGRGCKAKIRAGVSRLLQVYF